VSFWEESDPPGGLLLPGLEQVVDAIHCPLSPGKWDRWREDWVIAQMNFHDRLELPIGASIGKRDLWEKVPDLQCEYDPMLKRIKFLAGKVLMSMMVLCNFLSQHITPSSSVLVPPGYTHGRMIPRGWSVTVG
jgi:hypothetical protein